MLAVLIFLCCCAVAYPQNAFYDAKKLQSSGVGSRHLIGPDTLELLDNDDVYKVAKYYVPVTDSASKDKIVADFKDNPFMKFGAATSHDNIAGFIQRSLSSVGGIDVTNIANGIADLLIERAKQELTVAFFDRFQKFAKDNPEFPLLFPKTSDNLSKLLTYTYPQMLPALRDGFVEDLKQVTFHLDDVLELPRYEKLLQKFPEVKIAIRSVRLVRELETGASNAADIIKEFAAFPEWKDLNDPRELRNVRTYLQIASLLSESIRNDSTQSHKSSTWVSGKELKALFRDKDLFTIYLGLLYQQCGLNKIEYIDTGGVSRNFQVILAKERKPSFLFQNKLQEFFDLADKVDATLTDIQAKKAAGQSPSNDDYYNYINTGIDVIDYGFSIAKIFKEMPASDDYLAIARRSNDIYKDIYTKQYTQAVSHVVDVFTLLNKLMDAKSKVDLQGAKVAPSVASPSGTTAKDVKKLAKGDKWLSPVKDKNIEIAASINDPNVQVVVEHYRIKQLLDFIEKVKPYALFMANMVEAKDEDAVKAALENVILPVGSSSIKKSGGSNLSVQAYLGAYWAPSNANRSLLSTWTDKFGVIAPIGISWTPSWLSWKKGGSLSVFGSLFDLGAIVDYKLKKDPSATGGDSVISKDYSVKFGQLFSPGAYLVYGAAWNLPLSVGFGGQYGPGLSKINTDGAVVTNPSWRWSLFVAVDLPFFNLVNKKPKK